MISVRKVLEWMVSIWYTRKGLVSSHVNIRFSGNTAE